MLYDRARGLLDVFSLLCPSAPFPFHLSCRICCLSKPLRSPMCCIPRSLCLYYDLSRCCYPIPLPHKFVTLNVCCCMKFCYVEFRSSRSLRSVQRLRVRKGRQLWNPSSEEANNWIRACCGIVSGCARLPPDRPVGGGLDRGRAVRTAVIDLTYGPWEQSLCLRREGIRRRIRLPYIVSIIRTI